MKEVDRDRKDRVGVVFTHPKYGKYIVTKYTNSRSVHIRFTETGGTLSTAFGNVVSGSYCN